MAAVERVMSAMHIENYNKNHPACEGHRSRFDACVSLLRGDGQQPVKNPRGAVNSGL
jgi:hypothetical protein